jgi:hypothetical protein
MAEQQADYSAPPPETLHEQSDVNVRGIAVTASALIAAAAIIHVVVWWVFDGLSRRENARPAAFPAVVNPGRLPEERIQSIPEPRLDGLKPSGPPNQASAAAPVTGRDRLNDYGWIDDKKGIARIPIDMAMDVVVQQERDKARAKEKKAAGAAKEDNR